MFGMDQSKTQGDEIISPRTLPSDVRISPDTQRANRLPPGQSRTKKWPVLDASGPPAIELSKWRFGLLGLVAQPKEWTWREFESLPRVKVFADFHCVTRWSRLGNIWEGVSIKTLVDMAGGLLPDARFALVHAYDSDWTTNLPASDLLAEDALVAILHDGQPITEEHGGPARLIVPRLYAWKSAKWIASIEFLEKDKGGFWEKNGYHMHGDPWEEQRYGW
jgi:DMSO/TMAO reductase YedYZ molybdopterin-dependent catalytic subunit